MKHYYYLFICILFSCTAENNSGVKHAWGDTQSSETHTYEDCSENGLFPTARDYIYELTEFITSANSDVFQGELALEKICIVIADSPVINAYMSANERLMTVNTGMIKSVKNDAELAMIIAHELAHLSMHHTDLRHPDFIATVESDRVIDDIIAAMDKVDPAQKAADSAYTAIIDEIDKNDGRGQTNIDQLKTEVLGLESLEVLDGLINDGNSGIYVYRNEMVEALSNSDSAIVIALFDDFIKAYRDLYAETSAENKAREAFKSEIALQVGDDAYNWREIEADDVGLEFFIRSGLSLEAYVDMQRILAITYLESYEISDSEYLECQMYGIANPDKNALLHELMTEIKQGTSSHPAWCWRLLHNVYEFKAHSVDYGSSGTRVDVSSLRDAALAEINGSNP